MMFLNEDEIMKLEKGYNTSDLLDFDVAFYNFMANGLKDFAELTDTYPDEYEKFEDWKAELLRLSESFKVLSRIYSQGNRDPIFLHTTMKEFEAALPHLWN